MQPGRTIGNWVLLVGWPRSFFYLISNKLSLLGHNFISLCIHKFGWVRLQLLIYMTWKNIKELKTIYLSSYRIYIKRSSWETMTIWPSKKINMQMSSRWPTCVRLFFIELSVSDGISRWWPLSPPKTKGFTCLSSSGFYYRHLSEVQ